MTLLTVRSSGVIGVDMRDVGGCGVSERDSIDVLKDSRLHESGRYQNAGHVNFWRNMSIGPSP